MLLHDPLDSTSTSSKSLFQVAVPFGLHQGLLEASKARDRSNESICIMSLRLYLRPSLSSFNP